MALFRMYFVGLICHIGLNREVKLASVLIRDDMHSPSIAFKESNGTTQLLKLDNGPGNPSRVTFDGRGSAIRTPTFDETVPHLADITDGGGHRLKDKVGDEDDFDVAYAYVQYPAGSAEFRVHSFYNCRGRYSIGPDDGHLRGARDRPGAECVR